MRSSKNDNDNWSGQNWTSRTACYSHESTVSIIESYSASCVALLYGSASVPKWPQEQSLSIKFQKIPLDPPSLTCLCVHTCTHFRHPCNPPSGNPGYGSGVDPPSPVPPFLLKRITPSDNVWPNFDDDYSRHS